MSLNYSFAGKSVLITGGTSGIGRQLVQRFYEDGAKVYTVGKTPEKVQKLKKELPNVVAEVVDLTDWDATRKVIQSFGVIDHLVNNAGVVVLEEFMKISKETANLQFDVNIGAMINVSQVVAKGLIDAGREGSIVNIGGISSRVAIPMGTAAIGTMKAGVENLTKSMALELGAHKIRVNCVLPGIVQTPLAQQFSEDSSDFVVKTFFTRMINKRMISPDEVTDLVMFLLSPLSSMIVGESVVIDGGYLV